MWVWQAATPTIMHRQREWQPLLIEASISKWRLGKLLLDKYCLVSEREATSRITIYAVAVVENNDTPVDSE